MDEHHFRRVARLIIEGKVVPFLGAGVNLVGRRPDEQFSLGRLLPSGAELAHYLAAAGALDEHQDDLAKVSQNLAVTVGAGPLYEALHDVFDHDYPPTALHRFLAELPGRLRRAGEPRYQFIVTTNYDDALERAFADADEPFDLVVYIADGEQRGKFLHRTPEGDEIVVDVPNKYDGLTLDERSVIAKIHGAVDRTSSENDSFVVTEDHYIDYLTRADISNLIPVRLAAKVRKSHFLFLGYSLRDWNLRVILHRLWGAQTLGFVSWAVQHRADPVEQKSWAQRNVEILETPLESYLVGLEEALDQELGP